MKQSQSYHLAILKARILPLSENKTDWEIAKKEWEVKRIYDLEDGTCLCDYHPIVQHCDIVNRINKAAATVGSVCIKHFGLNVDLVFAGRNRLLESLDNACNESLAVFVYERGALSPREYQFIGDTKRKRILSGKQKAWRRALNIKILNALQPGLGNAAETAQMADHLDKEDMAAGACGRRKGAWSEENAKMAERIERSLRRIGDDGHYLNGGFLEGSYGKMYFKCPFHALESEKHFSAYYRTPSKDFPFFMFRCLKCKGKTWPDLFKFMNEVAEEKKAATVSAKDGAAQD